MKFFGFKKTAGPAKATQPPVFTFARTLKHPELSPRAAEYGF